MELAITSTSMKLRDRAPVVFRGEDNWCFEQIRSIGYDGVELEKSRYGKCCQHISQKH